MRLWMFAILGVLTITSSLAWADREAGREIFRANCIGCHAINCNKNGPKLGGILGRNAGMVTDFDGYSEAMKNSGIVWNEKTLNSYLSDPASFVPDNAMASFGRIENDTERRDLIDFLIKPDDSLDLCF